MIKILNIVGARPNFMKMAPIIEAMNCYPDRIDQLLVHTGQHYEQKMSKAFFEDLGMPRLDINLGVGSGNWLFYLEPPLLNMWKKSEIVATLQGSGRRPKLVKQATSPIMLTRVFAC